jgi:hypothetical protein
MKCIFGSSNLREKTKLGSFLHEITKAFAEFLKMKKSGGMALCFARLYLLCLQMRRVDSAMFSFGKKHCSASQLVSGSVTGS